MIERNFIPSFLLQTKYQMVFVMDSNLFGVFFYGWVWLANHFPYLHFIVESRKGTTGASPRGDDPNPSK